HLEQRIGIVAVVEDYAERQFVIDIEPPRVLEKRRRERAQTLADRAYRNAKGVSNGGSGEGVGDIGPSASLEGGWNLSRRDDRNVLVTVINRNDVSGEGGLEHDRHAALGDVFPQMRGSSV